MTESDRPPEKTTGVGGAGGSGRDTWVMQGLWTLRGSHLAALGFPSCSQRRERTQWVWVCLSPVYSPPVMASNAPRTSPTSASVACVYLLAFLSSDSHPDSLDPSHTGFLFFPLISETWQAFSPLGALVLQFPLAGIQFYPVQSSLSVMSESAIPWTAASQASLSITNSRSLLKLMSIESVMPSTISSSVVPFSSHLQSFPESRSFQMSQFFTSGGQSIGVSASVSVLTMNIQGWFPLWWTGLISLHSKGLSRVFSNITVLKASILQCSAFNSHIHTWLLEKP